MGYNIKWVSRKHIKSVDLQRCLLCAREGARGFLKLFLNLFGNFIITWSELVQHFFLSKWSKNLMTKLTIQQDWELLLAKEYCCMALASLFNFLSLSFCIYKIGVLMNYGWRFVTLYRRQGSSHLHGKEMQKSKMAVWGGRTNSCEKKRSEKQRRKGKI